MFEQKSRILAQIDEFGLVSIKAFTLGDLIHLDPLLNHCAGKATTKYEIDANFKFFLSYQE